MKKIILVLMLAVSSVCYAQNSVESFKVLSTSRRTAETNWRWENLQIKGPNPVIMRIYRNQDESLFNNMMRISIVRNGEVYFNYNLPYVGGLNTNGGLEFIGFDVNNSKATIELLLRETNYGQKYFEMYIRHDSLEMCYKFESTAFFTTR